MLLPVTLCFHVSMCIYVFRYMMEASHIPVFPATTLLHPWSQHLQPPLAAHYTAGLPMYWSWCPSSHTRSEDTKVAPLKTSPDPAPVDDKEVDLTVFESLYPMPELPSFADFSTLVSPS